eukprot:m.267355 g.267355  ORF g.267355 m.267355 type:complete len:110 (+) comp72633_c0_seq1:194-523(+)
MFPSWGSCDMRTIIFAGYRTSNTCSKVGDNARNLRLWWIDGVGRVDFTLCLQLTVIQQHAISTPLGVSVLTQTCVCFVPPTSHSSPSNPRELEEKNEIIIKFTATKTRV